MLKVLLFDDGADTAHPLREAVVAAGCEIVGEITSARALADAIARLAPDAVLMDVNSPSRDVLEQVVVASRDEPRPIVMFTPDGSDTAIEAALQAGVSAYVVDGIAASRIQSILQVAITRFRVDRRLREKLDDTEQRLAERKLIDRAKGLLMQHEKMDEAAAYAAMRSAAMKRGIKLADLAKQIITVAEQRA